MRRIKNEELQALIQKAKIEANNIIDERIGEVVSDLKCSIECDLDLMGERILKALCPNLFRRKKGDRMFLGSKSTKKIFDTIDEAILKSVMSPSPFVRIFKYSAIRSMTEGKLQDFSPLLEKEMEK